MSDRRRLKTVGHATSLFLAVSYLLCIAFCLSFPGYQMHSAWAQMLPGFEWLTPLGFVVGLAWSYLYGWFIAIVWVPLYERFDSRYQSEA